MSLLLIIVRVRLTSASTLSHEGGGREGYRAPKSVIDGDEVDGHKRSLLDVCLEFLVHGGKPRVASSMKIEPKTHFANERTFLQWFNSAVLLCSVGMALAGLGLHNCE